MKCLCRDGFLCDFEVEGDTNRVRCHEEAVLLSLSVTSSNAMQNNISSFSRPGTGCISQQVDFEMESNRVRGSRSTSGTTDVILI